MNEILHATEFQQIESAWRGLHYLVLQLRDRLDAEDPRHEHLEERDLPQPAALSGRALGSEPVVQEGLRGTSSASWAASRSAAMIGDYHFSHLPTDVQLLRDLSKVAGAAHAPFFAGADPTLLGMDSWTELVEPARHRQGLRHAGIRRVEGPARSGRFALCRAVHAARAVAPALRRQVGTGRGVRLRGGHRRPQG